MLLLLILLILLAVGGGFYFGPTGGPYRGGVSIGGIILILLVCWLVLGGRL